MKHISEIIDEILLDWSYRVHDGMPNPKNPAHLVELRDTMIELNIQTDAINLLVGRFGWLILLYSATLSPSIFPFAYVHPVPKVQLLESLSKPPFTINSSLLTIK